MPVAALVENTVCVLLNSEWLMWNVSPLRPQSTLTPGVLANGLFGGLGLHPGLIRDAAGRDNVRPGRTAVRLNLKFSSRFW